MTEELSLEKYLNQMGHSPQTVKSYLYTIGIFLALCKDADNFKYRDIIRYIEEQTRHLNSNGSKNRVLASIKKYYDYLVEIGRRNDHPCRTLILKGKRRRGVLHHDLFTGAELELLMEREERYEELKIRNQVVISLLIYQGLSSGELQALKVRHIDLDAGTIYIKESRKQTRRHLELQPKQYRILDKYIHVIRPQLLRVETETLLIGKLGTPLTVDDINYLVSTFKIQFPERNLNPKTIRQSVIANWLNEKNLPLEQVQLYAGHRWISSTAEYRYVPVEEQRTLINKFHPLG